MEPKDDHHEVVGHHLTTPTTTGTSFSQLLFGDDDDEGNALAFGTDHNTFNYNNYLGHNPPLFSVDKTPKMLCFGDYKSEGEGLLLPEANSTPQKSVITSSDSSSASSCNQSSTGITSLSKSNGLQKKRNGSAQQPVSKAGAGGPGQRGPNKKAKAENPISIGHAKRKEKLGERIAALQQLVSPFGKTDTASVLHEAMGYIRFLHDQVQVLCSPYLQRLPSSPHYQYQPGDDGDNSGEEEGDGYNKDLRSRGLCLVPVECTVQVASTNGADFWSPASIGNINVSPSA